MQQSLTRANFDDTKNEWTELEQIISMGMDAIKEEEEESYVIFSAVVL